MNDPWIPTREDLTALIEQEKTPWYVGDDYTRQAEQDYLLELTEEMDDWGYVYVIRCGDLYKIGKTTDIAKRIKQLQTSAPQALELVCWLLQGYMTDAESNYHSVYRDKRVSGEWFALTNEDVAYIQYCAESYYPAMNIATQTTR